MKYGNVQCFLLQPTDLIEVRLRRYTRDGGECPDVNNHGYHQAWTLVGVDKVIEDVNDVNTNSGPVPHTDSRWPTQCTCGYKFGPNVGYQYFPQHLYRRSDNGELVTWRDAPGGAMIRATWLEEIPTWFGTDGKSYMVKLPNGREWPIDGTASNCTRPTEEHKCWCRHGEAPNFTVDKNGNTCSAGAGSIVSGDYHGFLRNGVLEEC